MAVRRARRCAISAAAVKKASPSSRIRAGQPCGGGALSGVLIQSVRLGASASVERCRARQPPVRGGAAMVKGERGDVIARS
ncbi:hypothetical protein D3C71_2069350 [compost metagenome]